MEIVYKLSTKDEEPIHSGWYNTNKGYLYWFAYEQCWSCLDDRISLEYPTWWLRPVE